MKEIICLTLLLFAGCGTTIRGNFNSPSTRLRNFKKLHLMLTTASGAISVDSANLSSALGSATVGNHRVVASGIGTSIGASHAMSGSDQAILVAQDLAFELNTIGFDLVDSREKADIIALFSIGAIRYDPLVGWIADQAFLVLKNAKTDETICTLRADTQFITPTVKTIVNDLGRALRKYY